MRSTHFAQRLQARVANTIDVVQHIAACRFAETRFVRLA
jgi:hypothetical protein